MATSLNIKRKNIDLPNEVIQKLSLMAVSQGKSLKKFIETILINKANSITIEISENISPSDDEWFNDQENIASVKRGVAQMQNGEARPVSLGEVKDILGV